MKQLFLSFAAILLFAMSAGAQSQVDIYNNTGCEIEVSVTARDASCNPIGGTTPTPVQTIPVSNNQVFQNTTGGVNNFTIQLVVDPNGISGGPFVYSLDIQCDPFGTCGIGNATAQSSTSPATTCVGLLGGYKMTATGTNPTYRVDVDPH